MQKNNNPLKVSDSKFSRKRQFDKTTASSIKNGKVPGTIKSYMTDNIT